MLTQEQQKFVESLVAKQVTAIKTQYEGTVAQLQAEVRSLKADLLYTETHRDEQRRNAIHGTAVIRNDKSISREDYEKVLPAKLEVHSLEEIVTMQALGAGIDPRNEREFNAFLGVDAKARGNA
jgi:hypothetical protein